MPVSLSLASNQHHGSTSLVPSTLWLAIPVATGPVFQLAFLFQLPLETSSLLIVRGDNVPTALVCKVLLPSFSRTFCDASSSPQARTTAISLIVSLLFPPKIHCSTPGIHLSCMTPSPLLFHHRHELPETEGPLIAMIVTSKQVFLRNPDRTRYISYFFHYG